MHFNVASSYIFLSVIYDYLESSITVDIIIITYYRTSGNSMIIPLSTTNYYRKFISLCHVI